MPQLNAVPESSRSMKESDASADVSETASVFGALIEVYREQGYEQGYQKAMRDVLSSLVCIAEQYLRQPEADAADVRQIVYGYVEYLQNEIHAASINAGYVSGGLGI